MTTVAYSIGKASRNDATVSKSQRANPGPGAYAPRGDRYRTSPQWGLGSAKRADLSNSANKFVPGPNVYQIRSKVGEGPSYPMGEKTGCDSLGGPKANPGPGAYSPQKVTDVSHSYSMGSKTKFGMSIAVQPESGTHTKIAQNNEKTPGPGTYYAKAVYRNVNSGAKFGTDRRKGMGNEKGGLTPGPNAYRADSKSTVLRAAPAFGFGTSRRPQSVNVKQQRPGPGAYDIRGLTGTETQGRTLASKLNATKTTNNFNPGPGSYTPMFSQSIKSNPGWKIGTSIRGEEERNERRRNYPPPDSYNPNFEVSKNKLASWSFGTSQRNDMARGNKNPGPNNYDIQKKNEAPAYGMGLKLDNQSLIGTNIKKTSGNPGAGNYNPDFNPTKKKMPAFSMKSRHKNDPLSRAPGPGAYESQGSPDRRAAPSYGFGTQAQRGKIVKEGAPGPGNYSIPCSIGNLPSYTGARSKMAYV